MLTEDPDIDLYFVISTTYLSSEIVCQKYVGIIPLSVSLVSVVCFLSFL